MDRLAMTTEEIHDGCGFVHQRSVTETYPPHTHDFFEFFYIVSGRAIHNINGEKRLIQDGDLTLIRPDDIHSYDFINSWDIEMISTGFSREEFSAAISYLGADKQHIFSEKFPLTISFSGYNKSDIYQKIMDISHKQHSVRAVMNVKFVAVFFVWKGAENEESRQHQAGAGKAQRLYQENRQHHL